MPTSGQAFLGTLGRDQCGYQQTNFQTTNADYQHAANVQLTEWEGQLRATETRMNQVSADFETAKKALNTYFQAPWSDAMTAHMDNGFDCCAPGVVAMILKSNRMPAGNDVVETYNPPPADTTPVETYTPPPETSCHGQPSQYCSSDWSPGQYSTDTSGKNCVSSGFAATPAWSYACKDDGYINPEVCSNSRVTRYPNEYDRCVKTLDYYRRLSLEKRTLTGKIANMRSHIQYARNPNRSSNQSYDGNGFMQFMQMLAPIGLYALSQFMNSSSSSPVRHPGGRPSPRYLMTPYAMRPAYVSAPMNSPGYMSDPGRPPAYYGPNYGTAFSNNGVFGQLLPGLLAGAFGCSTGTNNAGTNLLSMLMGGATLNINASLGSNSNYERYVNSYGNRYAGIPPHTFGDRSPLYQPGGIYGTTPYYEPRSRNAPGFRLADGSVPYTYNRGSRDYLGVNANSYFADQQLQQQQNLMAQQSALDYELYRLRMSNQGPSAIAPQYQMVDLNALMPAILANPQQAGSQIYFNATSSGTL